MHNLSIVNIFLAKTGVSIDVMHISAKEKLWSQ